MNLYNQYFKNIPNELKELNQWVCASKKSKLPMYALSNKPSSVINNKLWSDFNSAMNAIKNNKYDYLGFVFNNNGIVGIDIDVATDEYGLLNTMAAHIIKICKSYTELSRSGKGIHILLRGKLPFDGRNNLKTMEIYQNGRYFILTGKCIGYTKIIENQQAIDYIIDNYFDDTRQNKESKDINLNKIYKIDYKVDNYDDNVRIKFIYPEIEDGTRNISLTSLAGSLHGIGYNKKQIKEILANVNKQKCKPPLPISEINTIVNSVTKYIR